MVNVIENLGLVATCGQAADRAAPQLAAANDAVIDATLRAMAARLEAATAQILDANHDDVAAAAADGMPQALVDRLRLDGERITQMAAELETLAASPFPKTSRVVRRLSGGFRVEEWRRPVGVIGANFEARPNVTLDVASQLIKSRNPGVLRTGSAALRSAAAIVDEVVAPALAGVGLDANSIMLIRRPDRDAAYDLVRQPKLIPLVILRGSGASTRALALEAAQHGVRTLAHADGGGVLYIDRHADREKALHLVEISLDRLGVCNRLNLLLVHREIWAAIETGLRSLLERLGIELSLPPHDHPLGHEWSLDEGREATVTVARVEDAPEAAAIANRETSGLAATIATEDAAAAAAFLEAYRGTGAFWNATTRLLDGFKLLALPETGINVDHVPGPRGPVTFQDLYLRQFVVVPDDDRLIAPGQGSVLEPPLSAPAR